MIAIYANDEDAQTLAEFCAHYLNPVCTEIERKLNAHEPLTDMEKAMLHSAGYDSAQWAVN